MTEFELRPARPDDHDALVELALASADTGRIAVSPKYLRNPVEAAAALVPELEWVVAEGAGGLMGAGQVVFSDAEIEGDVYRRATLTSLMVHPAHRRKGVARALTRWRLERAGPDAVIAAAIQTGNEGSFANARRWATQIFGKLTLPLIEAARSEPRTDGLEVREPEGDEEWEAAAAGLAVFERGWNLRTPETGAKLRERAERTLEGKRLTHYLVAVSGGRMVGGFELFESAYLQTFVVERLPAVLRLLNTVLRFMPPGGEVRANSVSRFWFEDPDVGRRLWELARFRAGETGNAVGMQHDPRGPLGDVVRVRPWMPKGRIAVAVRSPVPLDEEKLLSPP